MYSALLIVFREVLEAALVIGIVMLATQGLAGRGRAIVSGIAAGLIGSVIVAFFAESIAMMFEGIGQELFNASVLFSAVAMLAWHNMWMSRHAASLVATLKSAGSDVAAGQKPIYVLSFVVGLAVLREGSEIVLFMYGLLASGSQGVAMLTGSMLGLACGAAAGAALYFGLLRIPTHYLFTVTSWLILLLAAGMASQGSHFLTQAGYFADHTAVWDISGMLPLNSVPGQLLHALIGYEPAPTPIQLIFYTSTICIILVGTKLLNQSPMSLRQQAT